LRKKHLKAQMMKLELNFNNSTNADVSTKPPIAGYAVLPAVPSSEVYLEDCVKALKRFNDNHFDLAIVDPPYGMEGNKYCTTNKKFVKKGYAVAGIDRGGVTGFSLGNRPSQEYWNELFRVSKNQIVFGMQYFTNFLPPKQCVLIWDKKNHNSRQSSAEIAWTSFNYGVRIFTFDHRSIEKTHPTQKPIQLYSWILNHPMNKFCKEGDLILDTHLGSGSSRIAAYKGGFNFVGFEIDPEYYEKQEKRFNDFKSQLRLF
jgi:site-specific DNA-methyltransferase (adenine-specific)